MGHAPVPPPPQRCRANSAPGQENVPEFTTAVCTLPRRHRGFHSDGRCEWWHPEDDVRRWDEWVEVTRLGDPVPEFILAVDGREVAIADARDLYVHDRISIEELERRVEAALR